MPTRRPMIAANWKMNGTHAFATGLARALVAMPAAPSVDIVAAPPFTALEPVGAIVRGSAISLGAQTMDAHESGAYTGEIAAPMLLELGVTHVILGHSERREYFGETDAAVNAKVKAALACGLVPIVAVGETEAEHDAGAARQKLRHQTIAAFDGVPGDALARCVVAYEPIWAIGTGKTDSPENANATIGEIRACRAELADTRILYGGSMKPGNAAALLAQPEIDGGLVGGASLVAADFAAIVAAARSAPASIAARA